MERGRQVTDPRTQERSRDLLASKKEMTEVCRMTWQWCGKVASDGWRQGGRPQPAPPPFDHLHLEIMDLGKRRCVESTGIQIFRHHKMRQKEKRALIFQR